VHVVLTEQSVDLLPDKLLFGRPRWQRRRRERRSLLRVRNRLLVYALEEVQGLFLKRLPLRLLTGGELTIDAREELFVRNEPFEGRPLLQCLEGLIVDLRLEAPRLRLSHLPECLKCPTSPLHVRSTDHPSQHP